jgi:hypothetical protein
LGYLGTNLTLSAPPGASAEALSSLYLKNLSISFISFFLIQIGAIYNLIGNYYARIAVSGLKLEAEQENRITPTLAVFYLLISGFITAVAVKTGVVGFWKPAASWFWLINAACAGVLANCLVCGLIIYRALCETGKKADYRCYARPIRNVYIIATILVLLVAAAGFLFADGEAGPQASSQAMPEFVGTPF